LAKSASPSFASRIQVSTIALVSAAFFWNSCSTKIVRLLRLPTGRPIWRFAGIVSGLFTGSMVVSFEMDWLEMTAAQALGRTGSWRPRKKFARARRDH
jgi:hypothetical protein